MPEGEIESMREEPIPEYIKGCEHGFLFPQYCPWCNNQPISKVDLTEVYVASKSEGESL